MPKPKTAALSFIFITILIDVIGLGIIIPVVPSLIKELINGDLSQAAKYGGWLMFSYAVMQFIFSPVLGGLSDRYGRRPVLLASLFGLGIDYLLAALAPTILWLFIARIFSGIFGASFTTATAYIADISPPEKRAQNFGMIGAAFGLGFIIGPVIGGLLGQYSSRLPFFAAAGLSLLNVIYGYFVLPESLPKENRRAFDWKRANPIGSLAQFKKHPKILGLVAALVIAYIAAHANQSTWTYYTMEKFEWNEAMVGYSLGFIGLMVAIVQGGLIRIAIPKLGEKRAIYIGFFFHLFGFLMFALATKGWMMYLIMIPFALGGLARPTLQGIISNAVPANEQGELQGALTSLISLTSIIGPLMMTGLFAYFTQEGTPFYFPGAPFIAAAFLTSVSLILVFSVFSKQR